MASHNHPSTAGSLASVASSASAVTILAANGNRKGAAIYNASTQILYLGLSATTPTASLYTVQIPASGYYEMPINHGGVYTGIIRGIWASANGAALVTELT